MPVRLSSPEVALAPWARHGVRAFWATVAVAALSACAHQLPHTGENHRPMGSGPTGASLVAACTYAVKFNEDEATVDEKNYLDATYCLGAMDALDGLNTTLSLGSGTPLYCVPGGEIKPWLLARVIVQASGSLTNSLKLPEMDYALLALRERYPCPVQ